MHVHHFIANVAILTAFIPTLYKLDKIGHRRKYKVTEKILLFWAIPEVISVINIVKAVLITQYQPKVYPTHDLLMIVADAVLLTIAQFLYCL